VTTAGCCGHSIENQKILSTFVGIKYICKWFLFKKFCRMGKRREDWEMKYVSWKGKYVLHGEK
jgi:hypothetical protein